MKIKVHLDALFKNKWSDYALRFVIGGAVTVATGLVAAKFGPVVGGLFLAFPAIFPAGATLIEKREKKKKERAAESPSTRGADAVALDAFGSALGSIGLVAFAVVCWTNLSHVPAPLVLASGTAAWFVTSLLLWRISELRGE